MDLDHDACYRALSTRDARFDGRFFAGVRTTGIYCRPICPARTPRQENVSFYATAAAAQEAGFRPCLRCRPESSPDLAAWRGTSNTVSRALALIASGGLDDDGVDDLAGRLGVGERQLRRLFKQHLGASPVAVAQTRRVLFARQLIAETRMPLAEVALAAGFGSVRRFNATFQELYRRPPGELRRAGGGTAETSATSGITLTLPYVQPYNWTAIVEFLAVRAIPGVEAVHDSGHYHRSIGIDGEVGSISIVHDENAAGLRATINFPRVTALAAIVGRIRHLFDLAADPIAIGRHLSLDPLLAPLVARRPGLRVPGAWDGFELAVRAILGQQITVSAATRLAGRVVAIHGLPIAAAMPRGVTHVFPGPARLMNGTHSTMPGMQGTRVTAISALAKAVIADPGLLGSSPSLDGAIERLRAVRGIGDWTAQYIAMRALREPDAFPASDIGLLRAVTDLTGLQPNPSELVARAESWRPWRAYAALHLWAADAAIRSKMAAVQPRFQGSS